jgi:hypothetical protein
VQGNKPATLGFADKLDCLWATRFLVGFQSRLVLADKRATMRLFAVQVDAGGFPLTTPRALQCIFGIVY